MIWMFALGIICIAISMGSVQGGVALPFLFLNALMDAISRPLTQPTRFLVVTITCFSVCAAYGSWMLSKTNPWFAKLMVVMLIFDALYWGGLSLKPHNTTMPHLSCEIDVDGGMLIWPEDGRDGELGTSRLLQMQHEKPSVQIGIASWRLLEKRALADIRGAGFSMITDPIWNEQRLMKLGFTAVLVEKNGVQVPVYEARLKDCGDFYWMPLE